jgi:hypothetical protein
MNINGFSAGTKVLTKKGLKNIESITIKDEVQTADGTCHGVSEKMADKSSDIYELKILFQPDTKVTGSQRYYIIRRLDDGSSLLEWIKAKDILVGDLAKTFILDDCAPVWRPVKEIKKLDEEQVVYSLKVESSSFTANGAVVHD